MQKRYKNFDKDYIIKLHNSNPNKIPRLNTIIITLNFKDKKQIIKNYKVIRESLLQTPKFNIAKNSIASFNVKKGMETGMLVSFNKTKLFNFLDTFPIYSPKVLDYRGQFKSEIKVFKSSGILQISFNSDFPKFDYSFLLSSLLIPFKF